MMIEYNAEKNLEIASEVFAGFCIEQLVIGRSLKLTAFGDSMKPSICDGDQIFIEPLKDSSIHNGDVVLYHSKSGNILVHRVIRRINSGDKAFYVIKGDNLSLEDGLVLRGDIFGKVVLIQSRNQNISQRGMLMKLTNRWMVFRSRRALNQFRRYRLLETKLCHMLIQD